jgi:hypothetical protein
MKRIIKLLLSSIAVIVFLTSSTGISFVIHHCSDNNTSEFHLFVSDFQCNHEKPESCCTQSQDPIHNSHDCKINKHHNCCSNTKGFIKVNDHFNFYRNHFKFFPPLFSDLNCISSIKLNSLFIIYSYESISPPDILYGDVISTHISQFLI